MDGFLGQWSAISYKPSIGSGVMDMTPLMQGGNAGGSMRPSALGQSMGSTVIPAVGPASDAALRAASQQGFRPGAYERMPAPETAQNQNGPALCQFSFGQHARSWGDKSPYPMPRQFELLFGHIPRTNGPRYGEEGLDWSYLAPLDGGLSVGLHDGISGVRSRNGAAIGLTALNAQFTWSYMSRLLKARRGTPAEYERFIEEDQLETLSELWQSYRCLGVVFSQAEKDDAYLALRRAGISAIPNYYLTANYVRGGRVQVIDYSNGSGMINGAAIYLVLRYMPMTKDTMYSFLPELDEMGGGRYQAEATWFTDDAVETYYVPQMCWEARPQNGVCLSLSRSHTSPIPSSSPRTLPRRPSSTRRPWVRSASQWPRPSSITWASG